MKYIIDGHYDILMDVAARRKKGERQVIRRRYYPAFQKGGVTGIVASIFVDSQYLPYGALSMAMEQISALHCEIEETPDLLMLCTSADDFLRAAETGRIGFLLSFEGAEPVSSCLRRPWTGTGLEPQTRCGRRLRLFRQPEKRRPYGDWPGAGEGSRRPSYDPGSQPFKR